MCFCECKESNIWVQRSTDPKLSLRAGQDRGARHWKMLIVQDGSAHSARALSSTPTATGRAHLAHPRHGSPAFFMLVGDRTDQRPEYSLVRGRSLRKSGLFRRHHLPTRCSLRFPSWKRRAKRQQSIKAACAARSRFSQAAESCDLAMCLSKLAAMNLEVICDVQEVARTIAASAMTK